jgi:hypothetical protein
MPLNSHKQNRKFKGHILLTCRNMSARYYEIYNFNGSYILSISRLDRLQQSPYHNLQPQNADPTSTVPAPAAGAELQ